MYRSVLSTAVVLFCAAIGRAGIRTSQIEYRDGPDVCEGYLAYDDKTQDLRPAVLIFPEWWGITEHPKARAETLAKMGYVAFVADVYGKGVSTEDPKQAGAMAGPFKTDRKLMRRRSTAALDTLLDQKFVDKSRVAAIGYCFGGTCALELARAGAPLVGVISFHGDLSRNDTDGPDTIKAKVLICHGAADPIVSPQAVAAFEQEMKDAKANYQINIYSDAVHAFTNPGADKYHIPGIGYNPQADHRSWAAASDFFNEVFAKD